jgi:hypothetical protein
MRTFQHEDQRTEDQLAPAELQHEEQGTQVPHLG